MFSWGVTNSALLGGRKVLPLYSRSLSAAPATYVALISQHLTFLL